MADENRIVKQARTAEEARALEEARAIEETAEDSAADRQRLALIRTKKGIWFIVNTVAILILLRFLLKAVGANELNFFAAFLFTITDPIVWPFLDLFGDPPTYGSPPNENIFEFSIFVAIAIYYLLAWIITKLLNFAITRPNLDT